MKTLEKANELLERDRVEAGLAILDDLVEDESSRVAALLRRAALYRQLGRFEDAIADYNAFLEARWDDLEASALRAETRFFLGEYRAAAADAAALLERNPLHETALRVLHSCRRALGRDESPIAVAPPRAKPFFINPVVKTLEEDEASFPKAASAETGRFLYSFIRCCRPRVVAETGARLGYLSLCMGQALEDNGMGHLHAFGMFNDRPDYVSPVVGCCPNTLAASRAHVSHAGLSHRVTFHKGDSSAGLRALAEKEIDQIDLAFVDGDHSLEGCLKDWLAVDSVLRSGGFVILHDTIPQTSGWLGPRYVLEEVDARAGGQYRSINLPTCEGAGLGIIQKYSPASSPSWRPSFSDIVKAWLHRHRFW